MAGSPVGRLRLEGGAAFRRSLKAAGRDLADLKDLHKRVAELVADRARATAPVGPPSVHVRNTIRASGTASAAIVRAGSGKKVDYAMPLHWGHKITDKDGITHVVKAQPWISTAAQDLQPRWTELYLSGIQDILDTVEGTTTP